mmetsp:Transcript_29525/g.53073  ORF Transcript_29525/g.53073 Transcript_29525/m.53073 type:complete len:219 (-) Transcript_29525:1651-2307(-)
MKLDKQVSKCADKWISEGQSHAWVQARWKYTKRVRKYIHLHIRDSRAAGPVLHKPFVPLPATTLVPTHQVGSVCCQMLQCVNLVRVDYMGDGLWPMPWWLHCRLPMQLIGWGLPLQLPLWNLGLRHQQPLPVPCLHHIVEKILNDVGSLVVHIVIVPCLRDGLDTWHPRPHPVTPPDALDCTRSVVQGADCEDVQPILRHFLLGFHKWCTRGSRGGWF